MRLDAHLVGAALGAVLVAAPALAFADGPPAAGPRADGIVWQEAAPPARRSTKALVGGLVLAGVGGVATAMGAAVFASAHHVECLTPLAGGGGGSFRQGPGCGDDSGTMHAVGGAVMGVGIASILVGVPVAVWGGSREPPSEIEVGAGAGSARVRFTF